MGSCCLHFDHIHSPWNCAPVVQNVYSPPKKHGYLYRNYKVAGIFRPSLTVNWPNFRVTNVITDHKIIVPSKISISLLAARRLKAILKEPFCAHVIILHHDIKSPITMDLQNTMLPPSAPLSPPNYMM